MEDQRTADDKGATQQSEKSGSSGLDAAHSGREEPRPTDFRKHIWLLVTILATVIAAAVVARIWAQSVRSPGHRADNALQSPPRTGTGR